MSALDDKIAELKKIKTIPNQQGSNPTVIFVNGSSKLHITSSTPVISR